MVAEQLFDLWAWANGFSETAVGWWIVPIAIGVLSAASAGRLRRGNQTTLAVGRWERLIVQLRRRRRLQRLWAPFGVPPEEPPEPSAA